MEVKHQTTNFSGFDVKTNTRQTHSKMGTVHRIFFSQEISVEKKLVFVVLKSG